MGKKSGNRKDLSDLVTVVTVETVRPLPDNSCLTPGSDLPFPQNVFQAIVFFFWKTYSMVISNNIQLSWGKRTHWPRVLCGRGHVAYGCKPLVQKTNHTSLIIAEKRLSEKIKSGIINSDKCVQKNGKALESSKRAKGNHTALQRQRGCTLSNQMCLKCVFLCLATTLYKCYA